MDHNQTVECCDDAHVDRLFARHLPFRVRRRKGDWDEVAVWCVTQCGSNDAWQNEVPDAPYGRFNCAARWGLLEGEYWFASARDAFAFKMRWC